MKEAAVFLMRLMHARTDGHIMHLQTRSYAQHMALGEFYEGIGELIDSFAETYQGKHGLIEDYPDGYIAPGDNPMTYMAELAQTVAALRKGLPDDSELQNIIDEIAALIASTLYKLRFLK